MANRFKRRIVAVIDENGVRRWVLPREGTQERTTLDSIMQIAAATNAEHPELEECMPPRYADFVKQHHAMWQAGYCGQES